MRIFIWVGWRRWQKRKKKNNNKIDQPFTSECRNDRNKDEQQLCVGNDELKCVKQKWAMDQSQRFSVSFVQIQKKIEEKKTKSHQIRNRQLFTCFFFFHTHELDGQSMIKWFKLKHEWKAKQMWERNIEIMPLNIWKIIGNFRWLSFALLSLGLCVSCVRFTFN